MASVSFEVVSELLESHCIDCHFGEEPKGGINIEGLLDRFDESPNVEIWEKLERAIVERKMPPKTRNLFLADKHIYNLV